MSESTLGSCLAGPVRALDLAKRGLGATEARELAAWLSSTPGASDALKVLSLSGTNLWLPMMARWKRSLRR